MISLPELKRLTIISLNLRVQVQTITLKQQRSLDSLVFEHSTPASTFSELSPEVLSSNLYALVYELPSKTASTAFSDLESLLLKENQEYGVGVLHDISNNYSNFYIMLHQNIKGSLASAFKGSKLAIFKLSYNDLFGNNSDNFIKYLNEVAYFTRELIRTGAEFDREIKRFERDLEGINKLVFTATEKNGRLKKKIVTARNLIKKLAAECRDGEDFGTTLCIYCKFSRKEVLFLPCGHLICCKNCIVNFPNLTPDLQIGKHRVKCPVCKKSVELIKEVFY